MWDGKSDRRNYPDNIKKLEELTYSLPSHEAQLREELHLQQLIADASPIAIWSCRDSGEVIYMNNCWEKWSGQVGREALGMGWMKAIVLEDQELVFEAWSKVINNDGNYYIFLYRLIHKITGKITNCGSIANKIGNDLWSGVTIDLDRIGHGVFVR